MICDIDQNGNFKSNACLTIQSISNHKELCSYRILLKAFLFPCIYALRHIFLVYKYENDCH